MSYGSGNSGDYKKLKGQMIQVVDTDPLAYAGSWATGGSLNNARQQLTGTGIQTAALAIGGYDGSNRGYTENYRQKD